VVQEKLTKLGARNWQINEVAPILVASLGEREPLIESNDQGKEPEGEAPKE
jgi:hypothetical protein